MGIYDRPYYREEEHASFLSGRAMVVNVVLVTAACYLAQLFFPGLTDWCGLHADLFWRRWQAYQLLTYGFMHDPHNLMHVAFNMFFLWMFGREVEGIYGPFEFLRVYLTLIVMSGLVWVLSVMALPGDPKLIGASGGVVGILMLFTLHFPRREIRIWGVLPVPAWALMVFFLAGDLMGTLRPGQGNLVAYVAHLAGAFFAFVYFRSGWNLGRMLPDRWPRLSRPRLKLHDPESQELDLSQQVDRILEKISREGEASLSKQERRTLEEASRRYQRRRR